MKLCSSSGGYTLVEMVVVVAIIGFMASLATYSGAGLIRSARISRETSRLSDNLAYTRANAIAKYQQWRIRFDTPEPGSQVSRRYYVESCAPDVATVGVPCSNGWSSQWRIDLGPGTGVVPLENGSLVTSIVFDRTGVYLNNATQLRVCPVSTNSAGVNTCTPGGLYKRINLERFSGATDP